MAKMEHFTHNQTSIISYICGLCLLISVFCIGAAVYNNRKMCELQSDVMHLQEMLTKLQNIQSMNELSTNYAYGHRPLQEMRWKRIIPAVQHNISNVYSSRNKVSTSKLYNLINKTRGQTTVNSLTTKKKNSSLDMTGAILARVSRMTHIDQVKGLSKSIVKKPILKSLDLTLTQDDDQSVEMDSHRPKYTQRHRQKMVETLDEQQFTVIRPIRKYTLAAHFSGDSSKYIQGQDLNFNGNGHMRHLSKTYVDWKPSDWVNSLHMEQYFNMDNGVLTIKEPGLYLVYAQIYYLDKHDLNGYMVYKNSHSILQCTTMTHSNEPVMKSNTCYTAGVEHFSDGDQLKIQDLSDGRYSLFEKEKSFFGAVKLSDVRLK